MTSYFLPPGAWTRGRFWMVASGLFILQAALIWALAERDHKSLALPELEFAVRLEVQPVDQDQVATALFAEDPTLFQTPSRRGFSGRAWMTPSSPEYHAAETPSPEVWLSLHGSAWKPQPMSIPAQNETPLALTAPPASQFEPAAISLSQDPPPAPSTMRLTGELARRRLLSAAPSLPAQPGVQLLSDSIVQLAVDPAGQVISARVVGNSGSLAADAAALAAARLLRFVPSPVAWGEAVFKWQTIEPLVAASK